MFSIRLVELEIKTKKHLTSVQMQTLLVLNILKYFFLFVNLLLPKNFIP